MARNGKRLRRERRERRERRVWRRGRFAFAILAVACASPQAGVERPAPIPIPVEAELPNDVHWVRNSAEYRALALQTYQLAAERLRELAAGRSAGTWAVVLDADETVLDNSEYQKRLAARGTRFDSETWSAYVREQISGAVPGAAAFIRTVRQMGGRVAIVTNRDEQVCDATRANLRALQIDVDVVLCRPPSSSDKNPRFAAVANGSAAPGLPPLSVLMWVGDNIQDFPGLTQDVDLQDAPAFAAFGRTFIVLPNPMYGSWERNPKR